MGILSDLYHEETNFEFIKRSWRWAIISGILLVVSVGSFATRGLNQSIEFTGGTSFEVEMKEKDPDTGEIRDLLAEQKIGETRIQIIGDNTIRVTSESLDPDEQERALQALSEYSGRDTGAISVSDVGPSWGREVSKKALIAMLVFFVVVALYMIFRFELAMSIASILAVLHDVVITIGVYSITQFVVSPATVVSFLTILGFSLYDTVVVFDKIRDNTKVWEKLRQPSYGEMVNMSLNQVLMRSINTSIVAVLPVASLIIVGAFVLNAVALLDFALALAIGLIIGMYSSIFVATPLIVYVKRITKQVDKM